MLAGEDHVVVQARENRRDRRLANLTAVAGAVRGHELVESAVPLHFHDLEQLLTRVPEVLTEVLAHHLTGRALLGLQNVGDERNAATTTRTHPRLRLDLA